MGEARDSLLRSKDVLTNIKKPQVVTREETIEEDVGDSVTKAYCAGYKDGVKNGRWVLAQKLLEMM